MRRQSPLSEAGLLICSTPSILPFTLAQIDACPHGAREKAIKSLRMSVARAYGHATSMPSHRQNASSRAAASTSNPSTRRPSDPPFPDRRSIGCCDSPCHRPLLECRRPRAGLLRLARPLQSASRCWSSCLRRRRPARHPDDRPSLEIDGMLGFVRQVCAAVLHLRDLRVGIMGMGPIVVRAFLLPLPIQPRQIRACRRVDARGLGKLR